MQNDSMRGDQKIQADLYSFPYHYIPNGDNGGIYLARHWGFGASYIAALQLIAAWLRPIAEAEREKWRHIDIGCGDGALIYYLSKISCFEEGVFEGVDIDDRALSWAKIFNPEVSFYNNLSDLNLKGKYSSATLIEVLEHIEPFEIDDFIKNVASVICQNGLLIVTVPSIEKPLAKKHYQHFDFVTISKILSPYFKEVKIFGFERYNTITKFLEFVRSNKILRLDSPILNRALINQLCKTYDNQKGCGRIIAIGYRR